MAYAKYVRVVVIVEYISSFMSNNITRVYYYYVFLLCILHIMTSCYLCMHIILYYAYICTTYYQQVS